MFSKRHKPKTSKVEDVSADKVEIKKDSNPRMFSQTVTVNVTVNEPDDGMAECLSGCFSACIGLGKKTATS